MIRASQRNSRAKGHFSLLVRNAIPVSTVHRSTLNFEKLQGASGAFRAFRQWSSRYSFRNSSKGSYILFRDGVITDCNDRGCPCLRLCVGIHIGPPETLGGRLPQHRQRNSADATARQRRNRGLVDHGPVPVGGRRGRPALSAEPGQNHHGDRTSVGQPGVASCADSSIRRSCSPQARVVPQARSAVPVGSMAQRKTHVVESNATTPLAPANGGYIAV